MIPTLRICLYCVLFAFSLVLFGLTADRLHYTTHLSSNDPLNSGKSFYDPIVAELLFSTLLTMFFVPFIVHAIAKRRDNGLVYTFAAEIGTLSVLFIFWLVGAAIASSLWGDLGWCQHFEACRILSALVAFAWLGWIVILALLVISLLHSFANGAFMDPAHGRMYPRESVAYPPTSEYRA
ncbi:hypothetical protein BV25DRAFT_1826861 [Artomyces pyxidatus]|uniref:Uncharacterized protein n=1 Tax=Artomyces pyxidatus TaxID=48021 RepID=A0ACB8SYT5_9AGAM|nr:hypothetical protein BV25DRAFT_1826861 [Artomyces pyxidatus]